MAQATNPAPAAPAPTPAAAPANNRSNFPTSLFLGLIISAGSLVYLGGSYLMASPTKASTQAQPFNPFSHPKWRLCWKTIKPSDSPGNQNKNEDCDDYTIGNEDGKKIFLCNKNNTYIKFTVTINSPNGYGYWGDWIWKEKGDKKGEGKFFFCFTPDALAIGQLVDDIGGIHTLEVTPI